MEIDFRQPFTPNRIVEEKIRFRIPLYQRPYAWEEPQIRQLLNDLWDNRDNDTPYYIGILNIGKTETSANYFDLIDGQQRITTLMLIGKVFISYEKLLTKEDKEKWSEFLCCVDFYGRNEDDEFIKNKDNLNSTNNRMADGVTSILNFLKRKQDIEAFSNYVYQKASFFLSKMPDSYSLIDKNIQFVRMNNRGKQLEQHDILKGKLSPFFEKEDDKKNFWTEWNKHAQMGCEQESTSLECGDLSISEIINLNERINESQIKPSEILYRPIVSYPEFLLIALERFVNKKGFQVSVSHQKNKLLEEFGFGGKELKIWSNPNETIKEFRELLNSQYKLFTKYFIRRDKNDSKYTLKETDSFTESDGLSKLIQFQSYLYVSREPHHWMKEAFDWLSEKKEEISANDFLEKLKDIDNAQFKNAKVSEEDFLSFGKVDRRWFWRLDYYIWENNKQTKDNFSEVINNYTFKENRSIEHIKPQHPRNESVSQWKDEDFLMNSFGNLAMISSSLNSSLRNAPFEEKFVRIKEYKEKTLTGSVESLKMMEAYNKSKEWENNNIIEHQKQMIEILINSFPENEFLNIRERLKNYDKYIYEKWKEMNHPPTTPPC